MTVNEMITKLQNMVSENSSAGEYQVLLSADAEGNRYSPASDFEFEYAEKYKPWDYEIFNEEEWDTEQDGGFPGSNAVVIWPL